MPTEFKLPELGENVESGDVLKVLVDEGDAIEKDQPIIELETEKATIEVPSSVAGTVKKIAVKQGDKVKVGQTILVVDDGAPAEKKKSEKEAKKPTQAAPPPVAAEKEEVAEEKASQRRPPAEEEEEEVEVEEEAEEKTEKRAKEKAEPEKPAPAPPTRPYQPPPPRTFGAEAAELAPAAPSIRRLARELGVDINNVPGSGPGGRISADDVKAYARRLVTGAVEAIGRPAAAPGAPTAAPPLLDFSRWGEIERRSLSAIRRKTAEHMAAAWSTIPHVTQHDEADVTELEKLRRRFSPQAEAAGGKLTVTAIALKVVASALKVFPQFAASLDLAREELILKNYCHIGVAVDTEHGLLVPVLRDVDRKNILQLAAELAEISQKARNRKLSMEEMSGGVFTITNLGGIGGTAFTPIVNYPEVAILGLVRAREVPVWTDGRVEPRLVLPLSLSYDHRVIDGADAARFLRWVAQALEQPFLLPLQG